MGKVTVSKKKIYSDKEPERAEVTLGIEYIKPPAAVSKKHGVLPRPEMVDLAIEDPKERIRIPDGEGNLAISIQPGKGLGEIYLNVQFEGPYGQYDFCLAGHNNLLLQTSQWLHEFLGELAADFDVELTSEPCPYPEQRVALVETIHRLQGIHKRDISSEIVPKIPAIHEGTQQVQHE